MFNIANEARIPIDCEVFGLFRDLIPAQLLEEGAELGFGRQRLGLCPDFKLRLPTADGPQDCLGELKFISAGVSCYPVGVHWRGWTGFTMELSLERQADWLRGFRALGHYSVMWLGNGAREAQTCTPLSRAVPRQGWRTWCERLGVRRRSGSSARWSGSTDDFCQPRQSGHRPCVSWQEWD